MNVLIVYDSVYGNTRIVAESIGQALPGENPVRHLRQVTANDLEHVDLLILGSPTHGAEPTQSTQGWLATLGRPIQEGARAATFDTRLTWPFLEKWGGFAAPKMAGTLGGKGWTLVGEPGGFYVKGLRKGPLKPGQLERAAEWAKSLIEGMA
jgi:flavodoxin